MANIDVSAAELFAHFFCLDTHEAMAEHHKSQGEEPREIKEGVEGSRSVYFKVGVHLPAPYTSRLFEIWQTWKERKLPDGRTQYIMGFKPINNFQGVKETENEHGHITGHTTGIFIITEVAPNVCTIMKIQNIDFHASLPDPILNILTKGEANKAREVQDLYRRNHKEVDAEIREVLVKKMKKGVDLEEVRMDKK